MPRRASVLVLVAVLTALVVGAGSADATIHHRNSWYVSIEGKQTVRWSFAAEKPDECSKYLGTPSETAQGSGTVNLSFTTPKKNRIWAETYMNGSKLRLSDFATEGWELPAVFTKQGKFSVTPGMPCNSSAEDPAPLPKFSESNGCGTEKADMEPQLSWSAGALVLLGYLSFEYSEDCPGVFDQGMRLGPEESCTPKNRVSGIEGTRLQELHTDVSASEFNKGKAFDVDANYTYRCEFPSSWPRKEPLKVELTTRYEVAFTPRGK